MTTAGAAPRKTGSPGLARPPPLAVRGADSDLDGSVKDALDVLARSAAAAFALDRGGRIVYWNDGAQALLGWRADEVLGTTCYELLSGNDAFGNRYCGHQCPIVSVIASGLEPAPYFMDVKARGGSRVRVRVRTAALPAPGPRFVALVHLLERGDGAELDDILTELRGSMTSSELAGRSATLVSPFTRRELEILQAVSNGYAALNIAARLNLSHATVRNHIQNILRKLKVHSQVEAVSVAFRHGWM